MQSPAWPVPANSFASPEMYKYSFAMENLYSPEMSKYKSTLQWGASNNHKRCQNINGFHNKSNVNSALPHRRCFHWHQPCTVCLLPPDLLPVATLYIFELVPFEKLKLEGTALYFWTGSIWKVKVRGYFAWDRQAGFRQRGGWVSHCQNRPGEVDWQELFKLQCPTTTFTCDTAR